MRTRVFVAALALMLAVQAAATGPALSLAEAAKAAEPEAKAAEPEAKSDGEAKGKLEDAPSAEPVMCYRLLTLTGLEVPVGQAVELCAGTVDSFKTIKCFREAWGHPNNDGLGLPLGLAADLCRSIPRE